MKCLCLVFQSESVMEQMSIAEKDQLDLENWAFAEVYHDGGQLVVEWREAPPDAIVTVRMRDGKLSATDGPAAGTPEQLHGFYLLEVADLQEAIQVVSKMPRARLGSIELRPIKVA